MRLVLALVTGVLILTGAHDSRADDVAKVMCEQFAIKGATTKVKATEKFDKVFSPPHHAPRNVPIEVALPKDAEAFIHFPIVHDGTYLIYATDPSRLAGVKEKDGKAISTKTASAPAACADMLKGGLSADVEIGKIPGPRPIAIEFKKGAAETIGLIISRDPIN